jgi:translation initiation factor IF-2
MSEETTIRLSQIARKLNVATTTIVSCLSEKGFQIENKPNAKLTLEQCNFLNEIFAPTVLGKTSTDELHSAQSNQPQLQLQLQPQIQIQIQPQTQPQEETLPIHNQDITNGNKATPESHIANFTTTTPPSHQVIKLDEKISLENKAGLKGLTIIGKIDLVQEPPKPFPRVAMPHPVRMASIYKKNPRTRIPHTPNPASQTINPTINNSKNTPPPIKHKPIVKIIEKSKPAAPSESDIQEQIKTTLAKLSNTNRATTSRAKYRKIKKTNFAEEKAANAQLDGSIKKLQVAEFISANDLASLMGIPINSVLSTCMNLGMLVSINQRLDAEAITVIADEFDYQVEFTDIKSQEIQEDQEQTDSKDYIERAPIVTIMGHVDHGKTSLLDYIRNTKVTKKEAGGITQHIGAYKVTTSTGKQIAFLDTPGHEAFTAMRARGARITDIAIIVIAADDGVRPQTKEAINHAKLAEVPMIIAINKIDKPTANLNKVIEELAHLNILVEAWGGKYQSQGISAITGEGIEQLLEKVLLEAELMELKANPAQKAKGTVVEASLDTGRGYLVTAMIQNGTLHQGDVILAGAYFGKIKRMFDHNGQVQTEAGPATPVQILGFNGAPQAGDTFSVIKTEKEAREIAAYRQQILREQGFRTKSHITLDEIGRRLAIGDFKQLNIIIKGDVDGSVEALADSFLKLSTEQIELRIIHKGVGAITDSDVLLAATSDAIIIGFQVRPSPSARKLAEKESVEIRLYSIIYDAINNVKDAIEGMVTPITEEITTGSATVREVFKITKVGTVAGTYITDGYIKRNNQIRVIREGIVMYTGNIKHLKHFKEDVQQVKTGFECGIKIVNFDDLKVGDIIESFEQKTT